MIQFPERFRTEVESFVRDFHRAGGVTSTVLELRRKELEKKLKAFRKASGQTPGTKHLAALSAKQLRRLLRRSERRRDFAETRVQQLEIGLEEAQAYSTALSEQLAAYESAFGMEQGSAEAAGVAGDEEEEEEPEEGDEFGGFPGVGRRCARSTRALADC